MRKVNPDRIARLRERQFGDDGKAAWIRSMLCGVTGQEGTPDFPIDACHVGSPDRDVRGQSSRGAGADSTFLFPMRRDIHTMFDSLDEAKWLEATGLSKQWVREYAESLHQEWVRMQSERGE